MPTMGTDKMGELSSAMKMNPRGIRHRFPLR